LQSITWYFMLYNHGLFKAYRKKKIRRLGLLPFNLRCTSSLFSAWTTCSLSLIRRWSVMNDWITYNLIWIKCNKTWSTNMMITNKISITRKGTIKISNLWVFNTNFKQKHRFLQDKKQKNKKSMKMISLRLQNNLQWKSQPLIKRFMTPTLTGRKWSNKILSWKHRFTS
jgi:hypothetical protein